MKTRVLKMVLMGLAAIAGFSAIVMLLWNWLVPSIIGWGVVNYWQALGLLVLTRILFGGFKHGGHGHHHHRRMHGNHHHMREKWMQMTDEERKEFIKKRKSFMHHAHPFCGGEFFDKDFKPQEGTVKDNE